MTQRYEHLGGKGHWEHLRVCPPHRNKVFKRYLFQIYVLLNMNQRIKVKELSLRTMDKGQQTFEEKRLANLPDFPEIWGFLLMT